MIPRENNRTNLECRTQKYPCFILIMKKKKLKALGKKGLFQVTERRRRHARGMSAQAQNLTVVKPVLECFEKQKKCSHCLGDTGFEGVTVDFNL